MKICDICGKTTDRLELGPPEQPRIEMCGNCSHDLLARFGAAEKQLSAMRTKLRLDAIANWQAERKPAG